MSDAKISTWSSKPILLSTGRCNEPTKTTRRNGTTGAQHRCPARTTRRAPSPRVLQSDTLRGMASPRSRYVSVNLLPHHKEKLEQLVAASGTNRNNFFRMLVMSLTPEDIERLFRR